MTKAEIKVRETRRSDAQQIGIMAKDFATYLRALGDKTKFQFNAKTFLRDGFGRRRAFAGLLAELNGESAGYLLYHNGYDTDRAIRIMHIVDLYVCPEYRRQGVGRALMERVLETCKETGGKKMVWSVFAPNRTARRFYWHIGACYTQDMLMMKLPVK
ncbi:MAG TPA: GNAT family N-acetyltransferase [Dehalococcoidales bacterium]